MILSDDQIKRLSEVILDFDTPIIKFASVADKVRKELTELHTVEGELTEEGKTIITFFDGALMTPIMIRTSYDYYSRDRSEIVDFVKEVIGDWKTLLSASYYSPSGIMEDTKIVIEGMKNK